MVRFEISNDVIVEVSKDNPLAEILAVLDSAKAHIEHLRTHNYEDRDGYDWHILSDLVDATWDTEWHEIVYDMYTRVNAEEDIAYREYAEADFLEYASHKGEADFDWDFYSDWHKDIYGFRPRW